MAHPPPLLVLGPTDLLYQPLNGGEPVVLINPPTQQHVPPPNTVMITWRQLGACTVTVRTLTTRGTSTVLAGADLFAGLRPSPALTEMAHRATGTSGSGLVPLLLVLPTDEKQCAVYGRTRHHGDDACFIRLTEVRAPCGPDLDWLPDALAVLRQHASFLTCHEAGYRTHRPGIELELKITLRPTTPLATVWDLAVHVHEQAAAGELDGFVLHYRDSFQTWDFLNHLFRVTAPDAERGYVSFIPMTTGPDVYLVKRKHFTRDAPARREQLTANTFIPGSLERHVRDILGVTAHRLPTFRRVRYDVNVESLHSGNVFTILFDRCHLVDHPNVALVQCEIEYAHSRTLRTPCAEDIQDDMDYLAARLARLTEAHRLPSAPEHYSKLTWLTQQACP